MVKTHAIGIDLGTTYSCVGVWRKDRVEIITHSSGSRTMPSVIAFNEGGCIVGEIAKKQAFMNPTNTIFDAKRLIGRRYSDEIVQQDIKRWPFKVISDNDVPKIEVTVNRATKTYPPEMISGLVLKELKKAAEDYLGERVSEAVITVPAYFNNGQREATLAAARIAELNVKEIINEPTAAAIAYGLENISIMKKTILVYDLGGGTFDVSIVDVDGGDYKVRAESGDTHLGGEDFDNRLLDYCIEEFKRKQPNQDLTSNPRALRRLKAKCEEAKRVLSNITTASIEVDAIIKDIDLHISINRSAFESLCNDLFKRTFNFVESALKDAGLTKSDIHEIVLVGGSTRIPKIREQLESYFPGKKLNKSINPDEAVAYGATLQALNCSSGIDLPINFPKFEVQDVTPLSLGIKLYHGDMRVVIKRNTPIPCSETKSFTTSVDYSTSYPFNIYQGERSLAKDNYFLGRLTLSGLIPAPRGQPLASVMFSLDKNGRLHVKAVSEKGGRESEMTLNLEDRRLDEAEITSMVRQARELAAQDKEFTDRVEAMRSLETTAIALRQLTSPGCDSLSSWDKDRIKTLANQILDWVDSNVHAYNVSVAEIQRKTRELKDSVHSFGIRL